MADPLPLKLEVHSLIVASCAYRAKYSKRGANGEICKQFVQVGSAGVNKKSRGGMYPSGLRCKSLMVEVLEAGSLKEDVNHACVAVEEPPVSDVIESRGPGPWSPGDQSVTASACNATASSKDDDSDSDVWAGWTEEHARKWMTASETVVEPPIATAVREHALSSAVAASSGSALAQPEDVPWLQTHDEVDSESAEDTLMDLLNDHSDYSEHTLADPAPGVSPLPGIFRSIPANRSRTPLPEEALGVAAAPLASRARNRGIRHDTKQVFNQWRKKATLGAQFRFEHQQRIAVSRWLDSKHLRSRAGPSASDRLAAFRARLAHLGNPS